MDGKVNAQIRLDITGCGLDEWQSRSFVSGGNNLVPNIKSQDVVISGERIDSIDIKVE